MDAMNLWEALGTLVIFATGSVFLWIVPLGVSESPAYLARDLDLEPGDSLVLFTDGVLDALNSKDQPFKIDGVYESLKGGGPYAPEPLGQRIVKAVENHSSGRSQYDDITLLSFGRLS